MCTFLNERIKCDILNLKTLNYFSDLIGLLLLQRSIEHKIRVNVSEITQVN